MVQRQLICLFKLADMFVTCL